MAVKSLCKIDGCGKPIFGRGWCSMHYTRWHSHGDPEYAYQPAAPAMDWLKAHAAFDGAECLIWPFGRSKHGRGAIKHQGVQTTAPRIMCILAHGEPPTPEHEAAHSCGKGHEGCVNRQHLRWATHVENMSDRYGHGTDSAGEKNASAKINAEMVIQIRALKGRKSQTEIAVIFGLHQAHVSRILRRVSWSDVPDAAEC